VTWADVWCLAATESRFVELPPLCNQSVVVVMAFRGAMPAEVAIASVDVDDRQILRL
jgi:hypothetical protein